MDLETLMADSINEVLFKQFALRVGNVLVELLSLQSDLLKVLADDAEGIQARLSGFFSQLVPARLRQPVTAYTPLSPGVHLGFEAGATAQLTVEPKADFSLSPESCLNTVTVSYSGTSRWYTIEAYCLWSDFAAAQRYQLGVYAVPNRLAACQVILRLPEKDGSFIDHQFCVFELRPHERACNPSGAFALPDIGNVNREQPPQLILLFDTTSDLEIRFDYLSLYFA